MKTGKLFRTIKLLKLKKMLNYFEDDLLKEVDYKKKIVRNVK